MRTGRIALAFLTVAALLLCGGVSAFCMTDSHGAMKCCRTKQTSGTGMKQPDCCGFSPASPSRIPAGVETPFPSKISRDQIQGAALAESARLVPLALEVEAQFSPPLCLPPERSVPLFLLNTSLLR